MFFEKKGVKNMLMSKYYIRSWLKITQLTYYFSFLVFFICENISKNWFPLLFPKCKTNGKTLLSSDEIKIPEFTESLRNRTFGLKVDRKV